MVDNEVILNISLEGNEVRLTDNVFTNIQFHLKYLTDMDMEDILMYFNNLLCNI